MFNRRRQSRSSISHFLVGSTFFAISVGILISGDPSSSAELDSRVDFKEQSEAHSVPTACVSLLDPSENSVHWRGDEGEVRITAPADCAWSVANPASWITITSGQSGMGNGTVQYRAAENPGQTLRQAVLTIDGATHTIRQSRRGQAQCRMDFADTLFNIPASGGTWTASFVINPQCAWKVTTNQSWISLTGDLVGSGSGNIGFTLQPNTTGVSRNGTINFGLGTGLVRVRQTGNAGPVDAGADQTITLPAMAQLGGTVIGLGSPLTVSWTMVSGPSTVVFSSASSLVTSAIFNTAGVYTLRLTASDGQVTESDDVQVTVSADPLPPPPDPATVAPPILPSVATSLSTATRFLYTGPNPIQTGVSPDTIKAERVGLLRGRVRDQGKQPITNVVVSVLDRPELGQTRTRSDGRFDLAVNAGEELTLKYEKAGFISSQRSESVDWQSYKGFEDVILKSYDPSVTAIDLNSTAAIQVASGSVSTDAAGTRRSRLFFKRGTTATLELLNGTEQTVPTLNVRTTEFTVGPDGPAAMPGELPPTSEYTYAAEYSVDEAVAMNAVETRFSQPVIQYIENFLNFPTGSAVPTGSYDRKTGDWVPEQSGTTVKILSITNSAANLDLAGGGTPATDADYLALGIDTAERQKLAEFYQPGQSLWRVPLAHFSPWDCNYPPANKPPPNAPAPFAEPDPKKNCEDEDGCTEEIQSQTVTEEIEITRTGYVITYDSSLQTDRLNMGAVIPLVGPSPDPDLQAAGAQISVAGRTITTDQFTPSAGLSTTFEWDGLDDFGRRVQGKQKVGISVTHFYPLSYTLTGEFGQTGTGSGPTVTGSGTGISFRNYEIELGGFDRGRTGLGGWSFNVHHNYNPTTRELIEGTGRRRTAEAMSKSVLTTAGTGDEAGFDGDNGPAAEALLASPSDLAFAADGSYFIADTDNHRIRRVSSDGIITTVAGDGSKCEPMSGCGDGGPASSAKLAEPRGVAVARDGTLYISDSGSNRIRAISPDGIIRTVVGSGTECQPMALCGDGGSGPDSQLNRPGKVHLAEDGSLYIADTGSNRVRKLSTNGIIRTVAGSGSEACPSDNVPALAACIESPTAVALTQMGELFITANAQQHSQVVRLDTDGRIHQIADGICNGARPAGLRSICNPMGVMIGPDGNPYVASAGEHRIYKYDTDGEWKDIVGSGSNGLNGEGQTALAANLDEPSASVFAPNGDLYIAVPGHNRIRRAASPLPGFSNEHALIASEDGTEVFEFNGDGQHRRTLNALTGTPKYTFAYDGDGNLTSITDGDNNITTIERDGAGKPTGIRSPYGQLTSISTDANGYLASVTNPAGEVNRYTYSSGGLLLTKRDPRDTLNTFTYDDNGRLIKNANSAGGVHDLARTGNAQDLTVTHESPDDRGSTFRIRNSADQVEQQDVKFEDGAEYQITTSPDGATAEIMPDGSRRQNTFGPDPRWALQAPVESTTTLNLPAGPSYSVERQRGATLSDPANPFSLMQRTETFAANGRTFSSVYSAASRTFAFTTAQQRASQITVDQQERVTRFMAPSLDPVNITYDQRGRLDTVVHGAGAAARTFRHTYNSAGFLASIVDPLDRTVAFQFDPVGRMTRKTLADDRFFLLGYDPNGNLTSVTPPGRPAHSMTYNTRNLIASYTAPSVGGNSTTTFTHNADADLTRITRPDGQQINYAYNGLGQLQTRTTAAGTNAFAYDAASGRFSSVTSPGGVSIAFGYNGFLVTGITWAGPVPGQVGYVYNNDLNVSAISVNGSTPIDYTYDGDGLVIDAGGMLLTRDDQTGLLRGTQLGNVTDTITYNGFGEPQTYTANFNAAPIYSSTNTYDKRGRISRRAESIGSTSSSFDFGYDAAGRLSSVTVTGQPQPLIAYSYDQNDNRSGMNIGGTVTTATYDAQDRMLTYGPSAFAYTANGELRTKTAGPAVTTYDYDAVGNLRGVTMPDGTAIEYVIDGLDRRIGKRVNGTLIRGYLYQDDMQIAAELDGSGTVVSRFVYASRSSTPDYMLRGGQIYRLIHDHAGSVRLVVDASNGNIVQRIDYDEFGVVLADSNPGFQPFGFAGGLYDTHTKLTRFGRRDYDAETGRWTSKDPLLFAGGHTNLYAYAANDPVNFFDPTGTDLIPTKIYQSYGIPHPYKLPYTPDQLNPKPQQEEARKLELEKIEIKTKVRSTGYCTPAQRERIKQIEKRLDELDKEIQQKQENQRDKKRDETIKYQNGNIIINDNNSRVYGPGMYGPPMN